MKSTRLRMLTRSCLCAVVASAAPVIAGCAASAQNPSPATATAVPAAPAAATSCERPDELGPAIIPEQDYLHRGGVGAAAFSDLATTQAAPLEECGLRATLTRLATLFCANGPNPFNGDLSAAHRTRRGNTGSGGRCGSIIDVYEIPCPEKTYEVYSDLYVCSDSTADSWR